MMTSSGMFNAVIDKYPLRITYGGSHTQGFYIRVQDRILTTDRLSNPPAASARQYLQLVGDGTGYYFSAYTRGPGAPTGVLLTPKSTMIWLWGKYGVPGEHIAILASKEYAQYAGVGERKLTFSEHMAVRGWKPW